MSPLDHPLVKKAVETEEETREAPFLGVPFFIEGLALPPLTLRHFLTLRLAGNPFICGGNPGAEDVAAFLYLVTNQTGDKVRFAQSISHFDFPKCCQGIREYKDEAFFDRGAQSGADFRAYWSESADIVDAFGREYGWGYREIMDLPIAVILQLLKKIGHRAAPNVPLFNPLSDRALIAAANVPVL